MSLFNTLDIEVTRYLSVSIVKGRHVPSGDVTETLNDKGTIQPITAKEMQTLPENRREGGTYKVYTSIALKTTDTAGVLKADRLLINSKVYEVVQVQDWQNNIINHYKSFVSLIDDKS